MYYLSVKSTSIKSERTDLFHLGSTIGVNLLANTLVELLVLGVNVHRDLQELLVEEWNSSLETPSHGRFVGT